MCIPRNGSLICAWKWHCSNLENYNYVRFEICAFLVSVRDEVGSWSVWRNIKGHLDGNLCERGQLSSESLLSVCALRAALCSWNLPVCSSNLFQSLIGLCLLETVTLTKELTQLSSSTACPCLFLPVILALQFHSHRIKNSLVLSESRRAESVDLLSVLK